MHRAGRARQNGFCIQITTVGSQGTIFTGIVMPHFSIKQHSIQHPDVEYICLKWKIYRINGTVHLSFSVYCFYFDFESDHVPRWHEDTFKMTDRGTQMMNPKNKNGGEPN